MKKLIVLLSVGLGLGTCALLRAEGLDVPVVEPLGALLALITSFSAMSPIAIASAVIVILVQLMNKFLTTSVAKKGAVVALGVVYALVQKVMGGMGWLDAAALVMLTSGGAVAIYEFVIKPLLPKPAK